MSRWFRHYTGMVRDPKFIGISARTRQPLERVVFVWSWMLESASEREDAGRFSADPDEIAYILRCDPADIAAIVEAMDKAGLVAKGVVARWGDRQFESDSSKERVARYRDKKRKGGNDSSEAGSAPVTLQEGDETLQEAESDTDSEKITLSSHAPVRERSREELDELDQKLRKAGGFETSSKPGFLSLAPILGLLDQGLSLDEDILPVIRAKTHPGVASYAYFTKAILDSRATRAAAAAGRGQALARASPGQGSDRPVRGLASAHAGMQAVLNRRGAA